MISLQGVISTICLRLRMVYTHTLTAKPMIERNDGHQTEGFPNK